MDGNQVHKGNGKFLNPGFSAGDKVTNISQMGGCVLCGTLVQAKVEEEVG